MKILKVYGRICDYWNEDKTWDNRCLSGTEAKHDSFCCKIKIEYFLQIFEFRCWWINTGFLLIHTEKDTLPQARCWIDCIAL